jgi:hypothetical protein
MKTERFGVEELRLTVAWCNRQNETFNQQFSAGVLAQLWRFAVASDFEWGEFADEWPEEVLVHAVAGMSPSFVRARLAETEAGSA